MQNWHTKSLVAGTLLVSALRAAFVVAIQMAVVTLQRAVGGGASVSVPRRSRELIAQGYMNKQLPSASSWRDGDLAQHCAN